MTDILFNTILITGTIGALILIIGVVVFCLYLLNAILINRYRKIAPSWSVDDRFFTLMLVGIITLGLIIGLIHLHKLP